MKHLIEEARRSITRSFESDEYVARRDEILKGFNREKEETFARLGEEAKKEGLGLELSETGMRLFPIKDGKAVTNDEFQALSAQTRNKILKKKEQFEAKFVGAMRVLRATEKETGERLRKLDQDVALFSIGHLVDELREKYADSQRVAAYLGDVQQDMLENLAQFRGAQEGQSSLPFPVFPTRELFLRRYDVNVLVDNSELHGAPVVAEPSATYPSLVGKIEREAQFGALLTDFSMIRAGSLHRANGGFLVIPLEEILRNPFSWDALKRCIRNKEIRLEDIAERYGLYMARGAEPEPIPLDAKVILIGTPYFYYLLHAYDEDFPELFKVKADFDTQMDRNEENTRRFADFLCTFCEKDKLSHCDRDAAAKMVEYSSRLAGDQEKLSTRFVEIADVIREASFLAQEEGVHEVGVAHVQRAIESRVYRSSLIRDRFLEAMERGTIFIDTAGSAVGQVNGLSVITLGDFSFGRPTRITASLGLGRGGVLDIEREAKLGGRIHSKGVLILSGYLLEKFARERPLALSARLVFEQSYEEVEGDSASSAELYCLLSSLSGIALRQSLAVTGSVNQKGRVQPIGGVNEKIEGFFALCQARGLTGDQGVVIPEPNLKNLMLKEELVAAVEAGKFHIYPVSTVEEGIEVLSGVPAGQRREDGSFEESTVFGLVDRRLQEMAERLRGFQGEKKDRE
jgi:lon-related putative ATP-dependent protease